MEEEEEEGEKTKKELTCSSCPRLIPARTTSSQMIPSANLELGANRQSDPRCDWYDAWTNTKSPTGHRK
jgi:hypothetical protein